MKEIPLSKGKVALVSDEDYDFLMQWKWCASQESRGGRKWYAIRWERVDVKKRRKVRMHRLIVGLEPSDARVVDHLNGDGLDNRRENLEITTQAENMRRAPGWTKRTAIPGSLDEIDF